MPGTNDHTERTIDERMEIGVGIVSASGAPEAARKLEEAGLDFVFCGEHFFFHSPSANAFVALAAAAGATTRIKLLSSVTLLPLYPAAMAAKMAAVLDAVSDGRFHFGVGVGGEYPREFEALGVPLGDRGKRTDESLEAIRALFSGERTQFRGTFTSLPGVALDPAPARAGGPPIWVAGRSRAAQRRAGRFGDVWMPYMFTPEQLEASLATVSAAAADAGRDPASVAGSIWAWICVHEDGRTAKAEIAEVVGRVYDQDFSALGRYLVAGTPDEVAERLLEYRAAGARSAQLMLGCRPENEPRVLDLLVRDVLPRLRA